VTIIRLTLFFHDLVSNIFNRIAIYIIIIGIIWGNIRIIVLLLIQILCLFLLFIFYLFLITPLVLSLIQIVIFNFLQIIFLYFVDCTLNYLNILYCIILILILKTAYLFI